MGVPAPVFEYVAAPVLNKWDQDELMKWRTKREQYEAKLEGRCMVTGEDLSAIQVSVKNSVDSTLLLNLARYVFRKTPKEISDEEIIAEIDKKCGSLKNGYLLDVDALFTKMLKMNMDISDVESRILQYFADFNKIVDDHGLHGLLGDVGQSDASFKARMKLRCKILIANLQPAMLRTDVERRVEYENRFAKTNDATLFDLVMSRAQAQHHFHLITMESKPLNPKHSPKDSNQKSERPSGSFKNKQTTTATAKKGVFEV
ncbi:hypothetical protein AeNC1_017457 [Aphanomyces euteiches]|nr:hypothetical protein AeNC1_017457 [Aphanomyces euteiches]